MSAGQKSRQCAAAYVHLGHLWRYDRNEEVTYFCPGLRETPVADPIEVLTPQDLKRQYLFSQRTFGPGARTLGVIAHIRSELDEIEANPLDISEWIDVMILAIDGAMRAGAKPVDVIRAYHLKQRKNERRKWPDWSTFSEDTPIEHDRTQEV